MTNKNSRRSHDAFFRWLFADKNHLRALLKLSAKSNLEIQQFLAAVDPNTFVRIPDTYSNVDETGEADLAFRVNASSGDHALVGVLLEHKSEPDANTLAQMKKYVNSVMNAYAQSHSATQIRPSPFFFTTEKFRGTRTKIFRSIPNISTILFCRSKRRL
ncbi:Rpn family recombination-promoting nuclease/putative transposase [Hallerella porci]|uniref:YhgA-like transposase n=1 Tax=Hallerella porci TaxID=1945871 RepID=A0ABX5LI87_9BACT|nr:Rpn family recombination-promoting nuclease/putative transposase [Hallerella porci]PWK93179.1 putative YhgA-like transposase [Hallerella porci]